MFTVKKDSLTQAQKDFITETCVCKEKASIYNDDPKTYYIFKIDGENVYLPLSIWRGFFSEFPCDSEESDINITFNRTLLTAKTDPQKRNRDQVKLVQEVDTLLEEQNVALINAHTGFGKTAVGMWYIAKFGLKTLIITYSSTIQRNWKDEITEHTTGAVIQMVNGSVKKLNRDANIYIMGPEKASKFTEEDLRDIKFVIIDEAHMCTVKIFTNVLLKIRAKYVIGMTATPERADGLICILNTYFGDPETHVVRKENKPMTIVKLKTTFAPTQVFRTYKGKQVSDWVAMLTEIAAMEARHEQIANVIRKHPNECILLLCERKATAKGVYALLEGVEGVFLYIEKTEKYPKDTRVLISNSKKCGTGFDFRSTAGNLKVLILDCDPQDQRQVIGRLRNSGGIILDLLDDCKISERHYTARIRVYKKLEEVEIKETTIEEYLQD
jgi:hypothetical protein